MNETLRVIDAREAMEGAGVRIRRAIGIPELRRLDPFLMLDYFDSDRPTDYLAGFPDHPHRGFTTFTYMLEGRMEHRDSMGHQGVIGPGDAQWMKAASGVIHAEMPQQIEGRMAGFQLWVNLPAAHKMSAPEYQEYRAAEFPVVDVPSGRIKVLAGRWQDAVGPVTDEHVDLTFLDVALRPGHELDWTVAPGYQGFVFVHHGQGTVDGQVIRRAQLVTLDGPVSLRAGDVALHFIAVTGRPIGEPIAQLGPFVMNTGDELEQAMRDYRAGRLVQAKHHGS